MILDNDFDQFDTLITKFPLFKPKWTRGRVCWVNSESGEEGIVHLVNHSQLIDARSNIRRPSCCLWLLDRSDRLRWTILDVTLILLAQDVKMITNWPTTNLSPREPLSLQLTSVIRLVVHLHHTVIQWMNDWVHLGEQDQVINQATQWWFCWPWTLILIYSVVLDLISSDYDVIYICIYTNVYICIYICIEWGRSRRRMLISYQQTTLLQERLIRPETDLIVKIVGYNLGTYH